MQTIRAVALGIIEGFVAASATATWGVPGALLGIALLGLTIFALNGDR